MAPHPQSLVSRFLSLSMRKHLLTFAFITWCTLAMGQVDTTFIYRSGMPYGTLDIRISKSSTRYYYLQENKTFSFRQNNGTPTNSYLRMTSWDSSPYTQGNLREKNGTADYFIMNYRMLLPVNYNPSYNPGYPIIVMMHGAGERGNCWQTNTCYHADRSWSPNTNSPAAPTTATSKLLNNDHNLLHGGKQHLDARNLAGAKLPNDPTLSGRAFPGFVLFPQNLNGWTSTSASDVIRLVRLIAKKYNVDENRIYIHGLSNGGYGVYEVIKRAPWLFAAALTMSAVSDAGIVSQGLAPKIANIPMWTFQGGKDTDPTPAKTEGYVRRFREAGAVVRYSLYPNLGHGTWNTAYGEADFFRWILSQNKSNVHVFAGSPAICNTNGQGVRLQYAEGFRAYQWMKDGVLISGATGASYTANSPGVYRARFSRVLNPTEGQWNAWSSPITVTDKTIPQPVVQQTGTVLLKDLNFFNDARLNARDNYANYAWYKDGTKLSLTTQAVTVKAGTCTGPCTGNGAYTLVVSDFDGCPSEPSKPVQIFFSDQAPVNITAPSNFTFTLPNSSSVRLSWTDASTNEGGFEIWRRKLISGSTYTKWEMRALTNPNVNFLVDPAEPSSTFQYKIRAVSAAGRSNYTPSTTSLVVNTQQDTIAPGAPTSLSGSLVFINTIDLKWNAATDNGAIRQYRITYGNQSMMTGSNATTFTLNNLTLNTNYSITVQAEDFGGNLGPASNSVTVSTAFTGLFYEHSTGAWTDLDQINWNDAEFTGRVSTFSIGPRKQDDYFNFEYDGYLYITAGGTYQFQTISSDGSRLELDGVVIVDNDGIHGTRTITSANQILTSGPKRINVKFFEYDETHVLNVRYKGPDTNGLWVIVPSSALRSSAGATATGLEDSVEVVEEMADVAMTEELVVDIYPNPSRSEEMHIQIQGNPDEPVRLHILDYSGREVYRGEQMPDDQAGATLLSPDRSLPPGMYIVIVRQGVREIRQRIVVKE